MTGVICTFIDVTEQRKMTEKLRVASEDLQMLLDHVPARITSWLPDGVNRFLNAVAAAQFGVDPAAAAGKHLREILGEERYRTSKPSLDAALAGVAESHEHVDVQPDGSLRYSKVSFVPQFRDGSVVGVFALAMDVTELHASRQRVRDLAQRLETVRDDENKRVSRVLHERIAQDLFGMKLWIHQLAAESKIDPINSDIDREIVLAIDNAIGVVRNLADDLYPALLAHLPLPGALAALARQFGLQAGLEIKVTERNLIPAIGEKIRLVFFNAAQELLTNVDRHAQGSRVEILLRADAAGITMEVSDDGIGIDPAFLEREGSLGLLAIGERFIALGGSFLVRKNAGSGSTVSVSAPL